MTTRRDPAGRTTVMDLVPRVAGLFPVGRLDVTTEGLLILTNDGAFAERVSHPRYEVPRVYHAKVHRIPDADTLGRLRRGVMVEGQRMAVDRVKVLEADKNSWIEVTLHEGKHHEVKRLLEAVGPSRLEAAASVRGRAHPARPEARRLPGAHPARSARSARRESARGGPPARPAARARPRARA